MPTYARPKQTIVGSGGLTANPGTQIPPPPPQHVKMDEVIMALILGAGSVLYSHAFPAVPPQQMRPSALVAQVEWLPPDGTATTSNARTKAKDTPNPPDVVQGDGQPPPEGFALARSGLTAAAPQTASPGPADLVQETGRPPQEGFVVARSGLTKIRPPDIRKDAQVAAGTPAEQFALSTQHSAQSTSASGAIVPKPPPRPAVAGDVDPQPAAGQVVVSSGRTASPVPGVRGQGREAPGELPALLLAAQQPIVESGSTGNTPQTANPVGQRSALGQQPVDLPPAGSTTIASGFTAAPTRPSPPPAAQQVREMDPPPAAGWVVSSSGLTTISPAASMPTQSRGHGTPDLPFLLSTQHSALSTSSRTTATPPTSTPQRTVQMRDLEPAPPAGFVVSTFGHTTAPARGVGFQPVAGQVENLPHVLGTQQPSISTAARAIPARRPEAIIVSATEPIPPAGEVVTGRIRHSAVRKAFEHLAPPNFADFRPADGQVASRAGSSVLTVQPAVHAPALVAVASDEWRVTSETPATIVRSGTLSWRAPTKPIVVVASEPPPLDGSSQVITGKPPAIRVRTGAQIAAGTGAEQFVLSTQHSALSTSGLPAAPIRSQKPEVSDQKSEIFLLTSDFRPLTSATKAPIRFVSQRPGRPELAGVRDEIALGILGAGQVQYTHYIVAAPVLGPLAVSQTVVFAPGPRETVIITPGPTQTVVVEPGVTIETNWLS